MPPWPRPASESSVVERLLGPLVTGTIAVQAKASYVQEEGGSMLRTSRVLAFFLVALGISWAAWIPYAASQGGLIRVRVPAEFIWLAEYGPTFSAFLLTALETGKAGVRKLLRQVLLWRVAPGWYVFALLATPTLAILSLA